MMFYSTEVIKAMKQRKEFDAEKFLNGYVRFLDVGSKTIGVISLLLMVVVIWVQVSK